MSVFVSVGQNEDDEYWLRVRDHFPMVHLSASPYLYRLHGDSLTSQRVCEVILAQHRTWAKRASSPSASRHILGTGYAQAANVGLYQQGRTMALRYLMRGFPKDPLRSEWAMIAAKCLMPRPLLRRVWQRKAAPSEGTPR